MLQKPEKNYPGSSYFVSVYISDLILKGKVKCLNKLKTEKSIDFIFNYLESISNKESFKLFKNILSFSGADATITCVSSKNSQINVQKKCNPSFKINIDESFIDTYFSNQKQTTKSFIVSIIDGFIERDTEIFSLFEMCKKDKIPAILICRGISEDARRNN